MPDIATMGIEQRVYLKELAQLKIGPHISCANVEHGYMSKVDAESQPWQGPERRPREEAVEPSCEQNPRINVFKYEKWKRMHHTLQRNFANSSKKGSFFS